MTSPESPARIDALSLRFNEPVIPKDRIVQWVHRFPEEDREAALALLEKITFHSYSRLICETRELHAILLKQLAADGFDSRTLQNVDFSRGFTCKSGDIISYIYRKANALRSVDFKTFDRLVSSECTGQFCSRALVILDDYTGTGSQFIFQFIARNMDDIRVLKGYQKVYLASIVAHDNAFEKLEMLQRGECKRVLLIEEGQFPDYDWDWEESEVHAALCTVDWNRIGFVCVEREHPLLSKENSFITDRERELVGALFTKYGGDSTLTTSFLTGHHTFFYGAPNSLPKILYPLFSRVEDVSIYPTEHFIGVSSDIVDWTMDDTDTSGR